MFDPIRKEFLLGDDPSGPVAEGDKPTIEFQSITKEELGKLRESVTGSQVFTGSEIFTVSHTVSAPLAEDHHEKKTKASGYGGWSYSLWGMARVLLEDFGRFLLKPSRKGPGSPPDSEPPHNARYLVKFLPTKHRKAIEGDLVELYPKMVKEFGAKKANRWFKTMVAGAFFRFGWKCLVDAVNLYRKIVR